MREFRLLCISLIVFLVSCSGVLAKEGPGYGPGRVGLKILAGSDHVDVGDGAIWNSRYQLHLQLDPAENWRIKAYHVDMGGGEEYLPPLTTTGNPKIGYFAYKEEFSFPYVNEVNDDGHPFRITLVLDLEEDLGFKWGMPWAELRIQGVAIFLSLVQVDDEGQITRQTGAWVVPELITWNDQETEEDTINEEGLVVDTSTGEILTEEVTVIHWVGKNNKVQQKEHQSMQKSWTVDEAEEIIAFDGGRWGWWFRYEMAHPKTGHFIDSPVAGLSVETPTYEGVTDVDAKFDYFPGELVDISIGSVLLGSALADHKTSPLDIFPMADTEDPRVINMARLLQSLDLDGDPQGGIIISEEVAGAFNQAVEDLELASIDFSDDDLVEKVLLETAANALSLSSPISLTLVSADSAKSHLETTLGNTMFRKRASRTPDLASTKAKMNIATTWLPALPANATADTEAVEVTHLDEEGRVIETVFEAKPIIITYTDEDPETGAQDVWASVSRDDGKTWKRKNLSRSGNRSSYTLANGEEYYGTCKKPVFQVKGNKILVAWSSKYARGGKPRYAIKTDDDYPHDDVYAVDDVWGVSGPQRAHDYTEDGYPEVGEVPYSALWVCRGVIATEADVAKGVGNFPGDIVWFKPERLTSGRRDVNQIFTGAASGAGFGVIWQEDPEGVRPGRAVGPGEGWSGATTNHKTDIWYSYIGWGDLAKIDINFEPGGDPEHDLDHITRPKALVPMSLPVRISDNDVLNKKNMGLDTSVDAENVSFDAENLTRCVKFEEGRSMVAPDDPDATTADYAVLRTVPEDHYPSMNCTNCHVPWGLEPHNAETPTQGAPIPLVVLDAENMTYIGGFTNGDCVSCHFSNIVPRDRVIAMNVGTDEGTKQAECLDKGGIWKDGSDGGDILEAYYPYEGYPYIYEEDSIYDGTHQYGLNVPGLLSGEYYTFINHSGNERSVAITTDGRLLDGDTGASRPNLFMQPYVNADGKTSAWAIITYEETKGAGSGPPDPDDLVHSDDYVPEEGKNVIYHSFDFMNPDVVAPGHIMNPPETDEAGNPVYLVEEDGVTQILDYLGRPQLAYENARRGRFILQGVGAMKSSRTPMLMVYKMGEAGHGRPSDIFLSRWEVPAEFDPTVDNPYSFDNVQGELKVDVLSGQKYWHSGPRNMSSVTPIETTDSMGDPESDDPFGAVKVIRWQQTADNFADKSHTNRYDDARAHRGQIRGDFVTMGFSYTANWAAARNGNDKYDFFIRRSFDGGKIWTTDPAGEGVEHGMTWTYPSGTESPGEKVEEINSYEAGEFEAMRNLSQLPNHKESVIEPRIVAVPGTIKVDGKWTGKDEDKQNPAVFYVAYGTSTNPKKDPVTKEQDSPVPMDLYYSFSLDKGENYHLEEWVVNPDSDGNLAGETVYRWGRLAKGDAEQGEVQMRMTPDGSRFYATWLDEGNEGSDIMFRRIMSKAFGANNAPETLAEENLEGVEVITDIEEAAGDADDFTSESGGSDD